MPFDYYEYLRSHRIAEPRFDILRVVPLSHGAKTPAISLIYRRGSEPWERWELGRLTSISAFLETMTQTGLRSFVMALCSLTEPLLVT